MNNTIIIIMHIGSSPYNILSDGSATFSFLFFSFWFFFSWFFYLSLIWECYETIVGGCVEMESEQRDRCGVTDAPCDRTLSANNTFFSLLEWVRQSETVWYSGWRDGDVRDTKCTYVLDTEMWDSARKQKRQKNAITVMRGRLERWLWCNWPSRV